MKLKYCAVVTALALFSCKQGDMKQIKRVETFQSPIAEEAAIKKADSIISLLSLDDKLDLIKGYELFFIKGIEEFGLPQLYLSDASQGVNIRENLRKFHVGKQLEKSTAFPCTIQLASTWNPEISEAYAQAIGEECRAGGIAILLGPGMNIYRVSQNGRSFEYMGEDPFLVSRMVERYVVGMQNTGTITTLKHFIANNNEFRRKACNVIVGDRALREIYMPASRLELMQGQWLL
jgi:beta-glucosidase